MKTPPILYNVNEDTTVLFAGQDDGHLYCHECETAVWCQHLASVVSGLGDYELFFTEEHYDKGDFIVQIPAFPTRNIFMEAECAYRTDMADTLEVRFKDRNKNDYWLGFMHPGEARNTLRSMLFDWFTAEFATVVFTCPAGTHKPAQEAKVQKLMATEAGFLMTRFSIWSMGMCTACIEGSTTDFSDLVPDDERQNPWAS